MIQIVPIAEGGIDLNFVKLINSYIQNSETAYSETADFQLVGALALTIGESGLYMISYNLAYKSPGDAVFIQLYSPDLSPPEGTVISTDGYPISPLEVDFEHFATATKNYVITDASVYAGKTLHLRFYTALGGAVTLRHVGMMLYRLSV